MWMWITFWWMWMRNIFVRRIQVDFTTVSPRRKRQRTMDDLFHPIMCRESVGSARQLYRLRLQLMLMLFSRLLDLMWVIIAEFFLFSSRAVFYWKMKFRRNGYGTGSIGIQLWKNASLKHKGQMTSRIWKYLLFHIPTMTRAGFVPLRAISTARRKTFWTMQLRSWPSTGTWHSFGVKFPSCLNGGMELTLRGVQCLRI